MSGRLQHLLTIIFALSGDMKTYDIVPVPKPRQTRADKWKQRPPVMRYRAFADEVRLRGVEVKESGSHVVFVLPMPKSWSNKKRLEMDGQPHRQRPDIDNLCKSLLDAIFSDDSHVHSMSLRKIWGVRGEIRIEQI
jgi:Holliday junction resolvase RusA-like endonuclease